MSSSDSAETLPTRLGVLTPSSNTVLEPVLTGMVSGLTDVSLHFSRFPVTEISLSSKGLGQFEKEPMLFAADLLGDARVASMCWNGTSAGWLGFDRDRGLCAEISERTGTPATSSVLALDQLLRRRNIRRLAFVTPYTRDIQDRILGTFGSEGYDCVAERHVGECVNFAFAEVSLRRIAEMAREVSSARP
ncbi:MAG: maleate isomerase, partial [Actinomycetota bacterium]|nr:maleate isomerase [Actinomycetota bacterium]